MSTGFTPIIARAVDPPATDPYSPDNIPSSPTRTVAARVLSSMKTLSSPKKAAPASGSPVSFLGNKLSFRKRQRALSDEAEHAHKRLVSSSSGGRASSMTVNDATDDAPNGLTSPPTPGSTSNRNSDSEDNDRENHGSPDQDEEAPGNTQATQTDDEFHDAMDDPNVDDPAGDADTIHAASERSIVVSSRRAQAAENSIVVSPKVSPPMKARGNAIDKASNSARPQAKQPAPSSRIGGRNVAVDGAQESISVSGGQDEEAQTIHAKPRTAAKRNPAPEGAQDDQEYTVSRIRAHRIGEESGEVELLVQWKDSPGDNTPTWELEESLQENALDAVVKYWATVKGGRVGFRPYEVYGITGHKWLQPGKAKSKSLYLEVEWLGYKEKSMEPVRRFSQDQPERVRDYFESIGGRPQPPR